MDATEEMRKAIAERKRLTDEKIQAMRENLTKNEQHRQARRAEQRRTE